MRQTNRFQQQRSKKNNNENGIKQYCTKLLLIKMDEEARRKKVSRYALLSCHGLILNMNEE